MRRPSISVAALIVVFTVASAAFALGVYLPGNRAAALTGAVVAALIGTFLLWRRFLSEGRLLEAIAADPAAGSSPPLTPEFLGVQRSLQRSKDALSDQISDLYQSRHQLEVLLEGMQDGVLGVDAAGRVAWSNKQMEQVMEIHGMGGAIRIGRSLAHTLRDPIVLGAVRAAVDQQLATQERTATLLPGRIFDVSASPLLDGGAVVVLHDVTRAEAVERTQREFVANVSHELRTPLTSILGYVETLLDTEPLQAHARGYLETVLKNGNRMNRLTEDLLVLARVEDINRRIHPEPIPADLLLEEARRTAAGTFPESEVSFTVERTTCTPVLADELTILQVLGNLMENAAKYGVLEAGSHAHVILSAEEMGEQVAFRVRDFGPGIASEHQARIFERFYRVDKARSRESGGTGLGLAIAKHLVEEHGGVLTVTSGLGQGSVFQFTLPVSRQNETALSSEAAYTEGLETR